MKPDPKGELYEDTSLTNSLSSGSLKLLEQDAQLLPSFVGGSVGAEYRDWVFVNNQGTMRLKEGLTTGTSKFTWAGQSSITYAQPTQCNLGNNDRVGRCAAMGTERTVDKTVYRGFEFTGTTLHGRQALKHPHDFYGSIRDDSYTGTTVFVRTNLIPTADLVRGINIDTTPPASASARKADDTVIIYDMQKLKPGEKVIILST